MNFTNFQKNESKLILNYKTKTIIWNLLTIKIAENLVVEIDNIDFLQLVNKKLMYNLNSVLKYNLQH